MLQNSFQNIHRKEFYCLIPWENCPEEWLKVNVGNIYRIIMKLGSLIGGGQGEWFTGSRSLGCGHPDEGEQGG